MLYQAGQLVFVSPDQGTLTYLNPSKFKYAKKTTKIEAYGFPVTSVGSVQKVDSEVGRADWLLTLTQESFNPEMFQLLLNQKESTISSIQLPGPNMVLTVPATPFAVTITGLTADQVCYAQVVSDTNALQLTQVTGATAIAAGTFKVSTDTVTFHSSQAGATVVFYYLETKTSIKVIGGTAAPATFGYCAFKGIIKGTRGVNKHIWFPRVKYTEDFEQEVGDKSEIALEYDILTPAAQALPYAIWNVA